MRSDLHVPRIYTPSVWTLVAQLAHSRIVTNVIDLKTFADGFTKQLVAEAMRFLPRSKHRVSSRGEFTEPRPATIAHRLKIGEKHTD
jgi:hypothetical protein